MLVTVGRLENRSKIQKNKIQQMRTIQIIVICLALLQSALSGHTTRASHLTIIRQHLQPQSESQQKALQNPEGSAQIDENPEGELPEPSKPQVPSNISTSNQLPPLSPHPSQPPATPSSPSSNPSQQLANVPVVTTGQLSLNLTDLPRAAPELLSDRLNWSRIAVQNFQRQIRRNLRLFPTVHNDTPTSHHGKYMSNLQANNWVAEEYYKHQWKYISNLNNSHYIRCSIKQPFFNGEECVNCAEYFTLDTLKCQTAPPGKKFDPNVHNFVIPTPGYKTDLSAKNLDFGGHTRTQMQNLFQAEYPNTRVCPHDKPYYDGIICITCFKPYPIFKLESQRCSRCADNEQYSETSLGCYEVGEKGDSWTLPKSLSNIFTNV